MCEIKCADDDVMNVCVEATTMNEYYEIHNKFHHHDVPPRGVDCRLGPKTGAAARAPQKWGTRFWLEIFGVLAGKCNSFWRQNVVDVLML